MIGVVPHKPMKYLVVFAAMAFSACASKTVLPSGTMYYWGVAHSGNTSYITSMRTTSCKYLEDCAALADDLSDDFKKKWEWQKMDSKVINRASVFTNTWSRESADKEYAAAKALHVNSMPY